jgi:hypothetical protein
MSVSCVGIGKSFRSGRRDAAGQAIAGRWHACAPAFIAGDPLLHALETSPFTPALHRCLTLRTTPPLAQEQIMGKYVLGWFLGVPMIVLVAIYFLAH